MRGLLRGLSGGFIRVMILLGTIGVGLLVLRWIALYLGRGIGAPIGTAANRYRQFAQTGT